MTLGAPDTRLRRLLPGKVLAASSNHLHHAERAMVNRATFYRHYPDKYASGNSLFQEAIDQLACESIISMIL